jgi:hypothetical protein
MNEVTFDEQEDDEGLAAVAGELDETVLHPSDWTVGTIISQLKSKNIEMNPRFQRRDAWTPKQKSQFIESLIIGVPIPQIVLAERHDARGRFIVLDGKQRLLTIMQFWGESKGVQDPRNHFALSGLSVLKNLNKVSHSVLSRQPEHLAYFDTLQNRTIRTVAIRHWRSEALLHLIFQRLNTASVTLSPQELRQALHPGMFTDFVEEKSSQSGGIQTLLSLKRPDHRMRDAELLARYFAFQNYLTEYGGRMRDFVDNTFVKLNSTWGDASEDIELQLQNFEDGVATLIKTFGEDRVARKADSPIFNRAIFDALIFYAAQPKIAAAMKKKLVKVREAFDRMVSADGFLASIEKDTAGIPHTVTRFQLWGKALSKATGKSFPTPTLGRGSKKIQFSGFDNI